MSALKEFKGKRVVWAPLEGSQELAISCPANVILYHGTRGPGKTDSQVMKFRRYVGQGYGAFWRGVIFDREYKNLDDLVAKSMRWFHGFRDGARFLKSTAEYKWVWPTGEELAFRVAKRPEDYWNYHGQEFPFIGWNELTKYPNPELYDAMMSCNRSSFRPEDYPRQRKDGTEYRLPEIPLMIFATCNPYGVGHNWVKQKFIDPAKPGSVVRNTAEVFNPRTQQREEITKSQVAIFGSYKENKYLSPEYVLELESIVDPNKREAWLYGNWDITAGGMFDDIWSAQHNIVDPFPIPPGWRMYRSFDWGSSKPFSIGWWAESDGCDVVFPNGKVRSTKPGDLFRIGEWYGWNGQPNVGLRMLATQISKGVVERELRMGYRSRIEAGPADSSIYDTENGVCIAEDMLRKVQLDGKQHKGVRFHRADKSPGSRKNGWERMRVAIYNAHPPEDGGPREDAGLFVFRTCDQFIRTVPTIPRDPKDLDDVDTESEDHAADEARYVILNAGDRFSSGTTKGLGG